MSSILTIILFCCTAAYAEIVGESEKIIHEGSMLRLVCVVKRSTEPPSYVFWYFENRMINYDLSKYILTDLFGNKVLYFDTIRRHNYRRFMG